MKTLKSFAPVLLAIGLVLMIMLAQKLCKAQLPIAVSTDQPALWINNELDVFDQGDQVFTYFVIGDQNYISSYPEVINYSGGAFTASAFTYSANQPDDMKRAFNYGELMNIGVLKETGELYKVNAVFKKWEFTTGGYVPGEFKAYPAAFYKVEAINITHELLTNINEPPYAAWYRAQCPEAKWHNGKVFTINKDWALGKQTIYATGVTYYKGFEFELIQGKGAIVGDQYAFNRYDSEVLIKLTAKSDNPDCTELPWCFQKTIITNQIDDPGEKPVIAQQVLPRLSRSAFRSKFLAQFSGSEIIDGVLHIENRDMCLWEFTLSLYNISTREYFYTKDIPTGCADVSIDVSDQVGELRIMGISVDNPRYWGKVDLK